MSAREEPVGDRRIDGHAQCTQNRNCGGGRVGGGNGGLPCLGVERHKPGPAAREAAKMNKIQSFSMRERAKIFLRAVNDVLQTLDFGLSTLRSIYRPQ